MKFLFQRKSIFNIDKFFSLLIFSLLIYGIYLCYIGGYGSDEDTLPLIGAFESMMGGGKLMASRFTPYPVAELGIGFLSYNFGSFTVNLVTFLFLILGIIFFYLALVEIISFKDLKKLILICLSNPVLFFDNLEPIDYSWAFLPFAIGVFFLKKNYYELSIIFFGIATGTRIYFIIFALIAIFFFHYDNKITKKRKLILFLSSFFVGGLFYLPIWFENGFSLHWLTAVTPNDQGYIGLVARFAYKVINSITLLSFILILIFLFYLKKSFKSLVNQKVLIILIFFNLLLFFFIPAELSYLQPFIIFFYFLIIRQLNIYLFLCLILFNFVSWFIELEPLKIQYKSKDICSNVQAISADIDIHFKKGRLFNYLETRNKISCWLDLSHPRSIKILQGEKLK